MEKLKVYRRKRDECHIAEGNIFDIVVGMSWFRLQSDGNGGFIITKHNDDGDESISIHPKYGNQVLIK